MALTGRATAVRARIESLRGMCSDEESHLAIDAALGEVLDLIDGTIAPRITVWFEDGTWCAQSDDPSQGSVGGSQTVVLAVVADWMAGHR